MRKVLRSRINEFFDLDTRVALAMVADNTKLKSSELKKEAILNVFRDHDVKGITDTHIGPGTNRCAFKLGEYILKVATDHDGCIDNLKEFQMCPKLMPFVTMTYEVSQNGSLLIAEYARVFQSELEMNVYHKEIKVILEELSKRYLIGDVGLSSRNYSNWGLRIGDNKPVCLDYAYTYNASSNVMKCMVCGSPLYPSADYNDLVCRNPECTGSRKYKFTEIRERIGSTFKAHHIDHLENEAYLIDEASKPITLDRIRSPYLVSVEEEGRSDEREGEDYEMVDNVLKFDVIFTSPKKETVEQTQPEQPVVEELKQEAPAPEVKQEPVKEPAVQTPAPVQAPLVQAQPEPQPVEETKLVEESPEEDDTLAFSGDMEDVSISAFDDIPDTLYDPNLEGFNYQPDETDMKRFPNPNFISTEDNHIYEAVSKLSNTISKEFKNDEGYELIAPYIPENMNKEELYGAVQNAIFRSLVKFMKFKEIPRKDMNGVIQSRRFEQPDYDDIKDDQMDTLLFLQDFWENNFTRVSKDSGIQADWLNDFQDRLREKLVISQPGIDELVKWMIENWIEADEITEVESEMVANELVISLNHYVDHTELKIINNYDDPPIHIPFNVDLHSITPVGSTGPNDTYQWLVHFIPSNYFKTRDQSELHRRETLPDGDQIIFVEYGKQGDFYIGGWFLIDSFEEIFFDENQNIIERKDLSKDEDMMDRLNTVVDLNLNGTLMSSFDLNCKLASDEDDPEMAPTSVSKSTKHTCTCGHDHDHTPPKTGRVIPPINLQIPPTPVVTPPPMSDTKATPRTFPPIIREKKR